MSDGLGLALATTLPTVFSGIVPWTPSAISTAVWLDAADAGTITDVAGDISQWDDKSGNGRHATQGAGANQPDYVTGALNGRNVVDFGGSEWFDIDLDWLALDANHTMFCVTLTNNYVNIYGAANGGSGDQSLHVGFQNSSNFRQNRWGNDTNTPIQRPPFNNGQHNILELTWPVGGQKRAWQNGVISPFGGGPNASTLSAQLGGGRIGNVVGQGIYDGQIAEFILINSAVDAETQENMENYLSNKWGIALS